ncbi:MAG TPA: strawberry notch C-terminal domain-containing protein [Bacteroidia bacterium]|nr:strawberry notch C-terminal domain-containing protein [Bacteroidia bacterium]
MESNYIRFADKVEQDLIKSVHHNKRSTENLAATFGIEDKTLIKELTELAIVRRARTIAHKEGSVKEKFQDMLSLYSNQINLSHRTSQSIMLQQYSTPAPISYLAGVFAGLDKDIAVFEPSAGNGLLTLAANPQNVVVNEIDKVRRSNLETQDYKRVLAQDATLPFKEFYKSFDAVITNPPFGTLDVAIKYESFPIKALEQLMALRALDTMKDNGKAAIIIGGHTQWDEKGRIQGGKNRIFFNYLDSRYNVVDVININGEMYSRQGTSFNVRLILIDGRKAQPKGAAPLFDKYTDTTIENFPDLFERVMNDMRIPKNKMNQRIIELEKEALDLEQEMLADLLGAPYEPASNACVVLNTMVPDSMSFETQSALERIKEEVGGDMDAFVRHRLGYYSKIDLCNALSAEQTDAVAMAIYNLEAKKQGMIIGDQTGIGKGRIAAAMIRYAVYYQKLQPVFLTEKANLFSDIHRDLVAIGSGHLVPFIINGKESKTDVKDEEGNVIYQALPPTEQNGIFESGKIPANFDFVLATYSQFNSADKKPLKPSFLSAIAQDNIFIMDESHNSSGSSNTGEYMQSIAAETKGIIFLSATFAKRPDNMPIYAMKTCICDANMTRDELVDAISSGGVALQEVLSSQLVAEGQMIRRERSFEGVEVNYITLDEKAQEHRAIADNITEIIRDIIAFQTTYIDKEVDEMDDVAAAEGKETNVREGTSQAGVDNQPYFSKVFNIINQMLFSIKADAVADRAIMRLKEGKKPVIAFSSTMGSFIEQMETDKGMPVLDGDIINADFSEVLKKGLEGVMRYTEKDIDGNKEYKTFELSSLSPDAQKEYQRIMSKIKTISTGICISPIDLVIQKIKEKVYSVAEVTGRKYEIQLNDKVKDKTMGLVLMRKRINTNDAFRQFNNNEVDVLMINQSGSTGASAHAVPTSKVPANKVKQRVMIVLQAELNINTEVQKRGRINRTGQILKPIYDYVNSAIPAEKRLMMMLQKKLKSLDANTTSNQKQSTKILDVPDFLNKYGDKMMKEYLLDNPEINKLLGDPIGLESTKKDDNSSLDDAASKVSGRVAVLSTKMQEDFYNDISERYNDYVEYLKQVNEYDLEVEAMNLEAEMVEWRILKLGKGGDSAFGEDSILETVNANVLKKPFSKSELDNLLTEALAGKEPQQERERLMKEYEKFINIRLEEEFKTVDLKYDELIKNIPNEKKILKIENYAEREAAIKEREKVLEVARDVQHRRDRVAFENRKAYLDKVFKYYHIGKRLNYPSKSYDQGEQLTLAVFLGFIIDTKKKNPYAPGNVRLRIAISNSNKYLALPASYSDSINSIIGASMDLQETTKEQLLKDWEKAIKVNVVDRKIRHIITGNLLQAYSDFKGKLVSYTTKSGETKKGILMPESWNPQDIGDKVVVPILRALTIIKSLSKNAAIFTDNDIGIFRHDEDFKIIVPMSKQRGGDVYLENDILALVEKHNFEKTADKMTAILPAKNLQAFAEILQRKLSTSVTLSYLQFNMIKDEAPPKKVARLHILLPPKEDESNMENLRILELEGEALELEMELMAA